jgi:hypothetical protein
MENVILNLPHGQDQMVWHINFAGFNLGNLSIKVTKTTTKVLQVHYLERRCGNVMWGHAYSRRRRAWDVRRAAERAERMQEHATDTG